VGAAGGAPGIGGFTGGAIGTAAEGTAGASVARRVTRTVSFFSGTLEVCFDGAAEGGCGAGGGVGGVGWSLMRAEKWVMRGKF
jgi:hypothetical protein